MRRRWITLLLGFWGVIPALAHANWGGPFGTRQGLAVHELAPSVAGWTVDGPDRYTFLEAPAHFPGVTRYRVTLPAATGLCAIVAEFPVAQSNSFGDEVKTVISHLQRALTQRYGQPTRAVDERDATANNDDGDWMASLYKGERRYGVFWEEARNGLRAYPAQVAAVRLSAVPINQAQARVELAYEFDNFAQCPPEPGAAHAGSR